MTIFKLSEIASWLNGSLVGDDVAVSGISVPEAQGEGTICFINNDETAHLVNGVAAAYIVFAGVAVNTKKPVITVKDSRAALVTVLLHMFPKKEHVAGISDKASVDATAKISPEATIKELASVGKNCQVGAATVLYPGVTLGDNVVVGDNCILYPNVTVYDGCVIGSNVILHAGVRIGADGFGFIPGELPVKIPHAGIVRIEDDVEIGANSCVDRATIGETVIGRGTKIDNLVQIGHNVHIGSGCLLAAMTGVGGSTSIGDYVIIGGNVGLADHMKIGSRVRIAARTGAFQDMEAGKTYAGAPAIEAGMWMRQVAEINKLPELRKRVRAIEKVLEDKK